MNEKPPVDLLPKKGYEQVSLVDEMKVSYMDYAMSVIVSRALPDVRDGLKPVHRRILYHMKDSGYTSQKAYSKSARIVGEVMGRYHPHGDNAIYNTLVRMAQSFSMRLPLITGQGNFGSIDDDPPAAMRYTEARLDKAAEIMLEDIDLDTVPFRPNYDNSEIEPTVIPSKIPNLLINGSEGIAVGMATSIPPHNPSEVIDACLSLIDDPEISVAGLMQHIKGPDLPTAGLILNKSGILEAYRTGRGRFLMRGKLEIENITPTRQAIVISEIPYQLSKTRLIEKIADCVRNKIIEGINDIRDLSNSQGIRLVIELKRGVIADLIVNKLYKHTPLQMSYSINLLAIHENRPKVMTLKEMLQCFIEFRENIVVRRLLFELRKKQERSHDVIGLLIALLNIDRIIKIVRGSRDVQEARTILKKEIWQIEEIEDFVRSLDKNSSQIQGSNYVLSDQQIKTILDLPLQKLTALEKHKIDLEGENLSKRISELQNLLQSRESRLAIIKQELNDAKSKFNSPRQSEIITSDGIQSDDDLIPKAEMLVVLTSDSLIKRMPVTDSKAQNRGGKGLTGMDTRDDDTISELVVANTHDTLLFFTNKGIALTTKVWSVPEGGRHSKGRFLNNVLRLDSSQYITAMLKLSRDQHIDDDILFATSFGNVRRNKLKDFSNINVAGKIAMKLSDGEELVKVAIVQLDKDAFLTTKKGRCIRFPIKEVRQFSGRSSSGVRGIKLAKEDKVVSLSILPKSKSTEAREMYLNGALLKKRNQKELTPEQITELSDWQGNEEMQKMAGSEFFILTATDKGFGKLSSGYNYKLTHRGGSGFANILLSLRTGNVLASFAVNLDKDIILFTKEGHMIRCAVRELRPIGRRTQGVKLFNIAKNDTVVSVATLNIHKDDFDDETDELI